MKIAMLASESNPLIKSGGLADVVYSLSKELVNKGEDVSVFIPFYRSIKNRHNLNLEFIGKFEVNLSWRYQSANIFLTKIDGIKFFLIENMHYFERDELYGYQDDGERFAFLSLLLRKAFIELNYKFDIIHLHDWQVGAFPTLVREQNMNLDVFRDTKFIFTIHNEAFQGMLDRFFVNDYYGLSDYLFDIGKVELKRCFSTMKCGIEYSDIVTTVSPTHKFELLDPNQSFGLDGVLGYKGDRFVGILNGIDIDEFNPSSDPKITQNYGMSDVTSGKLANKKELLKQFNLKGTKLPTFGIVSRLTWQKGIRNIVEIADHLMSQGANLIVLGSGEHELEEQFEILRRKYPDNIGLYIGYNDNLAHKIYAGCDFLLMPSLFEPCGLSQMIALRYGTLPVVRNCGGLKDTVEGFIDTNLETANGIAFNDLNYEGLKYAVDQSLKVSSDKTIYKKLQKHAMTADHSWKRSAEEYLKMYKEVM